MKVIPASITLLLIVFLFAACSEIDAPLEPESPDPTPALKENLLNKNAMLDAVNEWRKRGCYCGNDTFPPVPKLKWDKKLEKAALRHSKDMAQNNFFSHTGSDGTSSGDRVEEAGYENLAFWAGENIAAATWLETEAEVVQRWIDSPGHCRTIMSDEFNEIGVALFKDESSQYVHYWTQNYGLGE